MEAKFKTKSNYRNLNDKWLPIKEASGTRISCVIKDEETGNDITVDFTLKECIGINHNATASNIHPIFSQALEPFGIS